MIGVVADDITGAAEIAGIGWRLGLDVRLVTAADSLRGERCGLVVMASNARSQGPMEAADITWSFARQAKYAGCGRMFMKCDSVLRGHVLASTRMMMTACGSGRAFILPANPSRKRTVQHGVYYIDGVPLNNTLFADDPEYPARSSDVAELLGEGVRTIEPYQALPTEGIYAGNCATPEEMETQVAKADEDTLLVGAADSFLCFLQAQGFSTAGSPPARKLSLSSGMIVVCGSTADNTEVFSRVSLPHCRMPREVFEGRGDEQAWIESIRREYTEKGSVMLSVGHPPAGGHDTALRLRKLMARATSDLLKTRLPGELIVEGGATAFALIEEMGWSSFGVTDEIAPGVVRLSIDGLPGTCLTLKPGSYPWGEII